MLSQPFWGTRGDRMKSRNALIRYLCLGAAALILSLLMVKDYVAVLLITCLFACFYMSIQPMGDSVILEALQKHDQPFGPVRMAGGLSFAFFSLLYGKIVDKTGNDVITLYAIAALLGLTLLSTFALPETPGRQAMGGEKMSMTRLFKMKRSHAASGLCAAHAGHHGLFLHLLLQSFSHPAGLGQRPAGGLLSHFRLFGNSLSVLQRPAVQEAGARQAAVLLRGFPHHSLADSGLHPGLSPGHVQPDPFATAGASSS